jgi:hypothetical protein
MEMKFNENWDGIVRKTAKKTMTEEVQGLKEDTMRHFTELDKAAKDVMAIRKKLKGQKIGDELDRIILSLSVEHQRVQDFIGGLISHLQDIHKKSMSPSKHGNMEIMRDLEFVIRELKKYQK